ncbi:MAG: hypothetical protein ACRDTJ_30480 [Pseudonocardiaceae bacterium]
MRELRWLCGMHRLRRAARGCRAAGRPSLIAVWIRQGFVALRTRVDRWDAVAAGYALVAAVCAPLTIPAAVAVLVPGALLIGLRATRPVRPLPAGGGSTGAAMLWLALFVAGGAWWLVAFLWGNDPERPTLSLLLDPVLETYPGRVLGYAVWLAAGRWLVSR